MYKIKLRKEFKNVKLKDFIKYLQTLNPEMEVVVTGDNWFFCHVDDDLNNLVLNIDNSDLDTDYVDDPETFYTDYIDDSETSDEPKDLNHLLRKILLKFYSIINSNA